jgi:hypothetical protein
MNRKLRETIVRGLPALAAALLLQSCYYSDPYGTTSVSGSYSSGYGYGYGYGGSSFNTSIFVSTGNPRWGYDPYCYSYYDYHRRCYYDPYLNGYYPIGYRPPVIIGVPHPYGWRPGRGVCPPPSYVRGTVISNYNNRLERYRGSSYQWARQVRQAPVNPRPEDSRNRKGWQNSRQDTDTRPPLGYGGRQGYTRPGVSENNPYISNPNRVRPGQQSSYQRNPEPRSARIQNQGPQTRNPYQGNRQQAASRQQVQNRQYAQPRTQAPQQRSGGGGGGNRNRNNRQEESRR